MAVNRSASDGRDGATVRDRVLAYVADALAVLGALWFLTRDRGWSAPRRVSTTLVGAGVVAVPYHVLLEGTWGRTPGKALLGITVVREDGGPCTYVRAGVRTALRVVDWLPAGYLLGLCSIALTERRQRVGDRLAGTVVVRTRARRDRHERRT